jgi:hypothetical protein
MTTRDPRFVFAAAILAIACFLLGQWSEGKTVRAAAADENPLFEVRGIDSHNALLLYYPSQRTIYVYQDVMTGNSALQCSYKFRLGDVGGVIRRQQCDVQRLVP